MTDRVVSTGAAGAVLLLEKLLNLGLGGFLSRKILATRPTDFRYISLRLFESCHLDLSSEIDAADVSYLVGQPDAECTSPSSWPMWCSLLIVMSTVDNDSFFFLRFFVCVFLFLSHQRTLQSVSYTHLTLPTKA